MSGNMSDAREIQRVARDLHDVVVRNPCQPHVYVRALSVLLSGAIAAVAESDAHLRQLVEAIMKDLPGCAAGAFAKMGPLRA